MPELGWKWLPIHLPVADLLRIVSEMCDLRLEQRPGGDPTSPWPVYWPEYLADQQVECRVVSTWSAASCTVTLRDDFHFWSERGETPTAQCTKRARADLPGDVTLFVEEPIHYRHLLGASYHLEGPPSAVDAIEQQWLAILRRDFFRPTWLDHPLVPDEWRLQARDVSIDSARNRIAVGHGRWLLGPVVLLAKGRARCSGFLVDQTEALPLGPLPQEPSVLRLEYRHPRDQSELNVPETFMRLLDFAGTMTETTRDDARLEASIGFLTMRNMRQLEDVMFRSWRADRWILRSQYSYLSSRYVPPPLAAHCDQQWAIQNEDGGPWAIFGQRTRNGLVCSEEYMDVRVVGEANPASAIVERLMSILATDGWVGGPRYG